MAGKISSKMVSPQKRPGSVCRFCARCFVTDEKKIRRKTNFVCGLVGVRLSVLACQLGVLDLLEYTHTLRLIHNNTQEYLIHPQISASFPCTMMNPPTPSH